MAADYVLEQRARFVPAALFAVTLRPLNLRLLRMRNNR